MKKLKFYDLDQRGKRLVHQLAIEADTVTPCIVSAASHVGELLEMKAFFQAFPRGSHQHEQLASRLQLDGGGAESIYDLIACTAPLYETLGARALKELADMPDYSENAPEARV